jgi:hypothetical protein
VCADSEPSSDGSGYFGGTPVACNDPDGTPVAANAPSDIAAALLGVWASCGTDGPYPGAGGNGVQFTSDGRFAMLTSDYRTADLLPVTNLAYTGTFTVVDASSTLGPGTYQVRFTADNGGVNLAQIVALGSPPRLRFFVPQAADFVPALTWKFRAGVCGPGLSAENACTYGGNDVIARMQGRWIWCLGPPGYASGPGGGPVPGAPSIGFDVHADGTFTMLTEDSAGNVIPEPPSMLNTSSGTLQVVKGSLQWIGTPLSTQGNGLPVFDACGRTLVPFPGRSCDCREPNSPTCNVDPCPYDFTISQIYVRVP